MVALADGVDGGTIPEARIAVVISNVADAGGLELARQRGIPTFVQSHRGVSREE
ncbi:MAG: phosphoribosylglycinamide formyltransferase, partial [Acidobacteria bacterium]|nr:phosphoribosylglycinamide formyltransferase [Acidobacteriota bacterium]